MTSAEIESLIAEAIDNRPRVTNAAMNLYIHNGRLICGARIVMPEDAVYSGKKAETWISFREQETEGMIKIEIASRLLISTRVEVPEEAPAEVPAEAPVENPEEAPAEVPAEAPAENPEEAPAETPEEAPAVQGNGAVGITAEPGGAETVSPVEPGFPWAILGSVLGVVLVGGAVFFLVRRKTQHA